jgi:hypothetical protein
MLSPREIFLKWKSEEEKKQYEEVMQKPVLTIEELWSLPEKTFHAWRKKYDYPKLFKALNTINSFVEWKNIYSITDEMMADCNVSEFIGNKKLAKDKTLYYLEQTFDGAKRTLVSHGDLSVGLPMFPENGESYVLLQKFISYNDWCSSKKIKPEIFQITKRQAPGYDSERVWLQCGYELLKMGGIKAPVNGFGILYRGKMLEFVNLCGLNLEGEIHFGEEGNLELSFCAADNITCKNLTLALPLFMNSTLTNLRIENSTIQQWRFWECEVTGDIISSKLRSVSIHGGNFTPYFRDTHLIDVEAEHKGLSHSNFHTTYSNLKKIYSDQGVDSKASEYFIKERELSREYSKKFNYLVKSIGYYYWGYGKKPANVIYYSIGAILLCSIIYFFFQSNLLPKDDNKSFMDCIYYSTITFTTLGYGDILPTGGLRIIALLEAFFGALSIGFLVAGFSNSKY